MSRPIFRPLPLSSAIALSLSLFAAAPLAQAQGAEEEASGDAARLDQVQVVGSRRVGGSETQTMLPVDVLPMDKAASQGGQFDLAQTLQFVSPSFNSTRQTGADGADLIDSAALRGLGSDQTLVLLNGKRRHSVSLVNLFGARNRGNTGTDFNSIPMLAVDRVEVLRDGAAAQYGSDAIAGVMNIALRKDIGCEAVAGYGEYTRGDGENYLGSGYCGFGVGDGGVIALTAEYLDRGRSNRATDVNPTRIIGDSKIENLTFFANGEIPVGDVALAYFHLGVQDRDGSSAAFARGGIGSDDIPSRNSAAMFPDGFVPFINGDIDDRSGSVGLRWDIGEWRADLSTTYGFNRFRFLIDNTLNASIANRDLLNGGPGVSATAFDAGGFDFRQSTTNLDFTRYFDGVFNGLNVAFGGEFRDENYTIFAGEPGSFIDADGPGGGNAGSQGFPGFQPVDETDTDRHSWAGYLDLEADLTDRLLVGLAGRFEDYSDFGSTVDGKLSIGFQASDTLLLRGSASTGFRAPSLQQRLFSSTFTDFVSGEPVDVLLARNGGPVAVAAGIPELDEETSVSASIGFTWQPADNLAITLDAYRIKIDDRIVLSGRFDTTDPNIGAILEGLGVGEAQFFVNSIDTRTRGIDLTIAHDTPLGGGQLNTYLAFNLSDTEVTDINAPPSLIGREDVLLEDRERRFIEEGGPGSKGTLTFDYTHGKWNAVWRFIYFGSQTLGTFSGPPEPNLEFDPRLSADVSLTYSFTDRIKLTAGGTNIFDAFPSRQNPDETDNGHIFESVQFGLNGAAWFTRLWVGF